VLFEVSSEVKQLKLELDSFKSPQVHVEISKVLKIIVKVRSIKLMYLLSIVFGTDTRRNTTWLLSR
jgi:hypothetical protein